jgi:hypothetical protein
MFNPEEYEFVNFAIDASREELARFCELVQSVNRDVRVLLTVSPVPLVATYEPRHVLVSTTYSKAVLRVAAEEVVQKLDFVDYFPSYEMIAMAAPGTDYYQADRREVEDAGVRHVMRCFAAHYVEGRPWSAPDIFAPAGASHARDVVCDEEAIADAIERTADGAGHVVDEVASGPFGDAVAWGPATVNSSRATVYSPSFARGPLRAIKARTQRLFRH